MSRRVRLPGADELFRQTSAEQPEEPDAEEPGAEEPGAEEPGAEEPEPQTPAETDAPRRGSGRVKHDEKMTVYLTAEELLEVEHARLALRRDLGRTIDRGRLVRAAIALALADYDARGADSDIACRLLR